MSEEVETTKNRDDLRLQSEAIQALSHYYKHGDSGALLRLVLELPNSNRRTAMLKWVHEFTVLRWDQKIRKFIRLRTPEIQRMDEAVERPFWNFKIKQEHRRHVSGNTFEADLFFEHIFLELNKNLEKVSLAKLEHAIHHFNRLLERKRGSKIE